MVEWINKMENTGFEGKIEYLVLYLLSLREPKWKCLKAAGGRFIHWFNRYLLITSYVPGTVPGAGDAAENKRWPSLLPWSLHSRGAQVKSTGEQKGWMSRFGVHPHRGGNGSLWALGMDETTWKDVEWKRRRSCVGHTGLEEEEETAKEYEKELPSFICGFSSSEIRFFQVAVVLRRISISTCSHSLSLLPSPNYVLQRQAPRLLCSRCSDL